MYYSIIKSVKDKAPSLFFFMGSIRDIFRYKFGIVSKAPYSLMIEINNMCNLRCSMCATKNAKRKKGFMSMDLYKKIINQAAKYGVKHVSLHTVGEPLLHKNLVEMIEYAKKKGLYVLVSSNGQLLNKDLSERLVKSGLDILRLSLEGFDKELYEKIRVGGSFDRLVDNVKEFRKIRDTHGKKPMIEINTILIKEDMQYAKQFLKFWNLLVDQIKFSIEQNQAGYSPHKIHPSLRKYFTRKFPCHLLWSSMSIAWNGEVSACCIDFENKLLMGNINKNTLKQIWDNNLYNRYRKAQMHGKFNKMPLCGPCNGRMVSDYKIYKLNQKINRMSR